MIYHIPDPSMSRLKSCFKRANKFAKKGRIRKKHPLFIAWSNCKMFLDAEDSNTIDHKHNVAEITYSLVLMDWFAMKVDDYAKTHMINSDKSLAAILYEWRQRMIFNPLLT